jgi:Aminoglycoside-2''-adenylyltransferase
VIGAIEPDVSKWDAWRPERVAKLLEGVQVPWYVAAGWALDLFVGEQRRDHEDLEIAAPNERFEEIAAALDGLELFVITGPTEATPLTEARDRLEDTHQTWVREPGTGLWCFDVFREPSDGDTWICRRDARIRMPYDRLIEWTADGIPYGRPEVILLYKARHAERERDRRDFADLVPLLDAERRTWLAEALALAHPGHAWIEQLGTAHLRSATSVRQ